MLFRLLKTTCFYGCLLLLVACTDFASEHWDIPEQHTATRLEPYCNLFTIDTEELSSWTVSSDAAWMTAFQDQGMTGSPISIYVEENATSQERTGIITVTDEQGAVRTWQVTQAGRNRSLPADFIPGGYERMMGTGWGYDCHSYLADARGVKDQIFNMAKIRKLSAKYPGELLIEDYPASETTSKYYSGYTAEEVSKEMGLGLGVGVQIPLVCSAEVKAKFTNQDMSSAEKSFVIFKSMHTVKTRVLDIENILTLYRDSGENAFTYGFNCALQKLEDGGYHSKEVIRDFVNIYGNCLVAKADIGGSMDYSMTLEKTKIQSAKEAEITAKVGLLSLFSMDVSASEKEVHNRVSENSKYSLDAKGGQVALLGEAVLDAGKQVSTEVLDNWLASINEDNSELIDCKLIPIWELITDLNARNAVRAYILNESVDEGNFYFPESSSLKAKIPIPVFPASSRIQVARASGVYCAEICSEFIPSISIRYPVTVVYPIVDNRPQYYRGIFVGDGQGHAPGYIYLKDNGEVVYERMQGYEPTQMLSELYYKQSELAPAPSQNQEDTYLSATVEEVFLNHEGNLYPQVKIGNTVWLAADWLSINQNGTAVVPVRNYAIATEGGIPFFTRCFTDRVPFSQEQLNSFAPVMWQLPSQIQAENLFKNFGVAHLMHDGLGGLCLSEQARTISHDYVLGTSDLGFGLLLTNTNYIQYSSISEEYHDFNGEGYAAPLRFVRADNFVYQ